MGVDKSHVPIREKLFYVGSSVGNVHQGAVLLLLVLVRELDSGGPQNVVEHWEEGVDTTFDEVDAHGKIT